MEATLGLTRSEVIERVRAARVRQQQAAVEELRLALEWARLHPCPEGEDPAGWGDRTLYAETVRPLAGPGAPWVAEFAPVELGAALGIGLEAARVLLADALELAHRLPRLWDLVCAGRVPAWRARVVSRETRDLGLAAASDCDRLLAAVPDRLGEAHVRQLVDEIRLWHDPDRAVADEEAALARRGVWLRPGGAPATTEVLMTLDTPDAILFDQSVTRVAGELKALGDTDVLDVRRARAVGVLADPQYALDLMSGRDAAAPSPGAGMGALNLFVHLTPDDLQADDGGGVVVERLGVATTDLLTDWLTRHCGSIGRVVVRPVLDLASAGAVDRHDPPDPMREAAVLRDATCVFPSCGVSSRNADLDHIEPYLDPADGGPPAQTTLANLAPLCRTHHRAKTHGGWSYHRLPDDTYEWTSPTGHVYLSGTRHRGRWRRTS